MKKASLVSAAALVTTLFLLHSCKTSDPAPKPTAAFTYVATVNGGMTFTNTSTNGTTYKWEFGDGSTSTDMSPSHVFSGNNTYAVILTVTGAGGTAAITQSIAVTNSFVGTWKLTSDSYINCTDPANNVAATICGDCGSYTYTATAFTYTWGTTVVTGTYTISGNTITLTPNSSSPVVATFVITSTTITITYDGSSHGAGCKGVEVDTKV